MSTSRWAAGGTAGGLTKADADATYRPRGARFTAYVPRLPLAATADAPTVTYTDSRTGSAPTTTLIAPADTRLTYLGAVYGTRTVAGNPCMINLSNGWLGSTDYASATGIGTTQPFHVEFDHYGTAFTVNTIGLQATYSWQVWVDGQPTSVTPLVMDSTKVGSAVGQYALVTFSAARLRRIRITLPANIAFRGVYPGSANDSFSAVQRTALRAVVIGDSWAGGVGTSDALMASLPARLELLTGWEVYRAGQGGTGYVTAPQFTTAFGSDARLNALASAQPDVVVITGSSNDDSTTGLQAAVAATLTGIATRSPGAKVIVVAPQNTSATVSAARSANQAAVLAAAQAAGNVVKVIDPIAGTWITGSGTTASNGTAGNANVFVGGSGGSDAAHLNDAGYDYWARRILREIATVPSLAA